MHGPCRVREVAAWLQRVSEAPCQPGSDTLRHRTTPPLAARTRVAAGYALSNQRPITPRGSTTQHVSGTTPSSHRTAPELRLPLPLLSATTTCSLSSKLSMSTSNTVCGKPGPASPDRRLSLRDGPWTTPSSTRAVMAPHQACCGKQTPKVPCHFLPASPTRPLADSHTRARRASTAQALQA